MQAPDNVSDGSNLNQGLPAVRADVDIEDLCQLCEQVPPGNAVTRFPMRAVKPKSKFETDLVNIVEWRGNEGRQFVLVRRPNKGDIPFLLLYNMSGGSQSLKGLLAGLYEFPSCQITGDSKTELLEHSYFVLDSLFEASFSKNETPKSEVRQQTSANLHENQTQVTHVQSIGDYVHVFSHIRKTYRIVSVVLGGGSSPPAFRRANNDTIAMRAKWILEKDVSEAK